jgi:hypothetical protein
MARNLDFSGDNPHATNHVEEKNFERIFATFEKDAVAKPTVITAKKISVVTETAKQRIQNYFKF